METQRTRSPLGMSLVCLFAVVGTAAMIGVDAIEWFYRHSRQHEAYDYDEIVAFMSLFTIIGLLVLSVIQRRRVVHELELRRKADEALNALNRELERRVEQRTSELEAELCERRAAEARLEESQHQLRRLSAEVSATESRERRRIADELHDNIGHSLAMASNELRILSATARPEPFRRSLASIIERIHESIRYSRSLVSDLKSPVSDLLPFDAAVRWLAEDVLKESRVQVTVEVQGEPQLPAGEDRDQVMLVLREVLVNIVKHAEARSVHIVVRAETGRALIYVADDGIGFEIDHASPLNVAGGPGFGLHTAADRLHRLGGRLSVQSRPGRGTWVSLAVPIAEARIERLA